MVLPLAILPLDLLVLLLVGAGAAGFLAGQSNFLTSAIALATYTSNLISTSARQPCRTFCCSVPTGKQRVVIAAVDVCSYNSLDASESSSSCHSFHCLRPILSLLCAMVRFSGSVSHASSSSSLRLLTSVNSSGPSFCSLYCCCHFILCCCLVLGFCCCHSWR